MQNKSAYQDFKHQIDAADDPVALRDILEMLDAEIDHAIQSPYESVAALRTTRDLELLLRYGEYKLEKLLA
jgi:hypothetical protein